LGVYKKFGAGKNKNGLFAPYFKNEDIQRQLVAAELSEFEKEKKEFGGVSITDGLELSALNLQYQKVLPSKKIAFDGRSRLVEHPPIVLSGIEFKRKKLILPSGRAVQILVDRPQLVTAPTTENIKLLEGNGATNIPDSDDGFYSLDQPWPLYQNNCHSYAVGDFLGLPRNSSIEGIASDLSDGINTLEVILGEEFEMLKSLSPTVENLNLISTDQSLQANDVVVFVRKEGQKLHFAHSCKVVKVKSNDDVFNFMDAKIGEDRAITSTLEGMYAHYAGIFPDIYSVQVYRHKD
jgi:hypothetical protein